MPRREVAPANGSLREGRFARGAAVTPRWLAVLCAAALAVLLRWRAWPWPEPGESEALDVVAVHDAGLFTCLWLWAWLWPAAAVLVSASFGLSAWDVWGPRVREAAVRGRLPPWPLDGDGDEPALVVGEQHHPVEPVEVDDPSWLTIPAPGLFTGTVIFGATGSGKTAACMRPFAAQLFGWRAADPESRASGLVLEVKGDFCHQVKAVLEACGRGADYVELGVGGRWQWNPLDAPEIDSYSLAYQLSGVLNQLFGRGKEPFWQQASTNLLRNLVELHRIRGEGWVTLRDLYRCAIEPELLESRLEEARDAILDRPVPRIRVRSEDYLAHAAVLAAALEWIADADGYATDETREALDLAEKLGIGAERVRPERRAAAPDAEGRLAAVERWLAHDWKRLDAKLRTSIVEGVSVFLGVFDQPEVARTFCPSRPPQKEGSEPEGPVTFAGEIAGLLKPLPRLRELIENGTVLCLNMPTGGSAALARAVGVMLKGAWLQAALQRPADMAADPERRFRPAVFVCDEYQSFATVGEDEPAGDEKLFPLTRQSRVIPIVATQSISSLRSVTRADAWKTLLQSFRTRVFLTSADADTSRAASEMCGTVERLKASYNFSENSSRAGVSLLSGRAGGARASVGAGRSYQVRREPRFHPNDFDALATCEAVVIPFDGWSASAARRVYLKPHWLPRELGYFEAVRQGRLQGRAS